MIIQLRSVTSDSLASARRDVEGLAGTWGYEVAEARHSAATPAPGADKIFDPVSLTALALSIPPAALAVTDHADRIRKRRRAKELLDQAKELAGRQVTAYLEVRSNEVRVIELDSLTPTSSWNCCPASKRRASRTASDSGSANSRSSRNLGHKSYPVRSVTSETLRPGILVQPD